MLTNYFRHFIKGYDIIIRLLTELLKRDMIWNWRDEEQSASIKLRNALMNRLILALFTHGIETEVHTDASALGIAGRFYNGKKM